MADLIERYSPNTRWGKQHVEVVFQLWAHRVTHVVQVGGNCRGLTILENAVDQVLDKLWEEADVRVKKGETHEPVLRMILIDRTGTELETEDDEQREEEWLKDMVVSAKIVGYDPPTLNEVRKMNGADPVPHGDVPYAPT